MGLSDRLKDLRKKAEDTAAEHKEQIDQAVEKAEAAADQRTEGRYHEQIGKAGAKAEAYVQNLKPRGEAWRGGSANPGRLLPGAPRIGQRRYDNFPFTGDPSAFVVISSLGCPPALGARVAIPAEDVLQA